MEAILLVGGMGNRLRPLTVNTPKPMLPVGGVPFIAHQLAQARAAGVDRVVLATSYKAQVFTDWLGDGARLGIRGRVRHEESPLGTGGAIRNVADRLFSKPDDPVRGLQRGRAVRSRPDRRRSNGTSDGDADVTLYLTEVDDARAFGCVPVDEHGRVTAFLEKMPQPVTNRINAGCYVFRRSVIDTIPFGEIVSVERQTFPELLADGASVIGFVDTAYWLDLGTPQAFVRGSRDLVLGRVASPALPGSPGERIELPGPRCTRRPRCAAARWSDRTRSWRKAPSSTDPCSRTGPSSRQEPSSSSRLSGLRPEIGRRTVVDRAVVGDGARVGSDCELAPDTRIWVDAVLTDKAIRLTSDEG